MNEYHLGEPVTKSYLGKQISVEHKGNHTEIKFGNDTLTLTKETMIEGLAETVWCMASLYNPKNTAKALEFIYTDLLDTFDDQDLKKSQLKRLQDALALVKGVKEELEK